MSGRQQKSSPLVGRKIVTTAGPARIVAARRRASLVARIAYASKGKWKWTVWQGQAVVIEMLDAGETDLPA